MSPGPVSDSYRPPDDYPTIPIEDAERIAVERDFDQVVIIARNVDVGVEHVTTFGKGDEHGRVAALMGDHLKRNVMNWPPASADITTTQFALRKVLAPERYRHER